MGTTLVIVEILIVGLQSAVWILLCLLALFGHDWVPRTLVLTEGWESLASVYLLALCYTLGVAIDRISDMAFILFKPHRIVNLSKWNRKHANAAQSKDRMAILVKEGRATDFLENIRGRARVARSTCINLFMATASMDLYVLLNIQNRTWSLIVATTLAGSVFVCLWIVVVTVLEDTYGERLAQAKKALDKKE